MSCMIFMASWAAVGSSFCYSLRLLYLQEAIELCTTDEEREAISSELAGHIWEAVALHSL